MTLDDLIADVDAEEVAARRTALDLLPLVYAKRAERSAVEDDLKKLEPPLRDYMNRHGGEPLGDKDESLYVASFQSRSGGVAYSPVLEIYEKAPAIFERLLKLGILGVDPKREKDARSRGELAGIDWIEGKWWWPIDGTPSLQVRRKE